MLLYFFHKLYRYQNSSPYFWQGHLFIYLKIGNGSQGHLLEEKRLTQALLKQCVYLYMGLGEKRFL